jgi:Na+/H+ antiporter NhaC
MDFGIFSLIPVLTVLIIALLTKKVFEPLLLGGFLGFIILAKEKVVSEWLNAIYAVLSDPTFQWIVLVTALFGAFVMLLEKSGGAAKFSSFASKYVHSRRGSLLMTWVLGLLVFIDDYLNTLAVGTAMRSITDGQKVPREMLAYVLKSTSSPLAIITPFSTWAVFMAGLLAANGLAGETGGGMGVYLKVIPFNLYGFAALFLVPLVIIGIIPVIGKMKKAYARVEETGNVFPLDEQPEKMEDTDAAENGAKLYYFYLPLVILVGVAVFTGNNLIYGVLAGLLSCAVIFIFNRAMNFTEYMEAVFDGIKSMVSLIALMLMAFVLVRANEGLGLTDYVISIVQPMLTGSMLPVITFLVVCFMGFCTGSFWGVAAIMMPIILPLAQGLDVNAYLAAGAVISGVVFGSHACFFADSLFLASYSTQLKPMTIALSMLPYALIAAALTAAGYVVLGFMI